MVLQRELYKKYEGFETEELPKTPNDAGQTDLQVRLLIIIARQTLCFIFGHSHKK